MRLFNEAERDAEEAEILPILVAAHARARPVCKPPPAALKANGLEPYHYLRHIFTELPKASTVAQIEKLLPHNLKPNGINPLAR